MEDEDYKKLAEELQPLIEEYHKQERKNKNGRVSTEKTEPRVRILWEYE